jgi:predicted NBD/HSP70 family sugar kinase
LNGRLYRWARMVAGEIGQTLIDYQGKDFVYGNKSALEALGFGISPREQKR